MQKKKIYFLIIFFYLLYFRSSFAKNLFEHIFVPTNLIKSQNSLKLTIDISGILYDLSLKKNAHLTNLHQTSFSNRTEKKLKKLKTKDYFDHGCFYHGSIGNIPSSEAALSICEGIQGYIRLNETIYFVEPLITSDVKQLSFRKKRSSESLLHIAHKIFLPDTQYQDVVTSLRKKNEKINERHKRSVIKDLYIEVLAVADLSFQEFLESIGKNTELYILTLFNMISSIYRHPSIGVSLHVVVNSIMLLEDDEILEINSDIDETLENFCQFQTYVTSKFTKKRIHDVAVLLTQQSFRPDTESNKSILGLAKLGGMCEIENSCNVNYHHGISVAFTIAHEIGHNINADHDSESCSGFNTLMQTQIDFSSNSFEWSNCSRKSIQDFLDEGHGHCLENEPEIIKFEDFKHLASLPNLASSFEIQCKLEYGPNATDCLDVQIFQGQCERLFCQSDPTSDVCITSFLVADGTRCVLVDEKNFNVTVGRCKDGTCLSEEKFSLNKPVDGGWGQWPEDWTSCSHECNGGIQFKERFCNNPAPQNNGKFCLGQRKIFRTCNLHSCETNENFFKIHNDLCQNFSKSTDLNEIKDFGTLEHFYFPDEPCKLLCNPEKNSSIFFDTLQKVPDGTRCSPYSQNVCLHGICNSVGCDGELGEESIYDACRVCNGDNSTCLKQKILIKINSDTDRSSILYEIPRESTSIAIMNENSKNLIELKNIYSENDDLKDFSYSEEETKEFIKILGPITQILGIQLIRYEIESNIEIEYYTKKFKPTSNNDQQTESFWQVSEWSNSSCLSDPCSQEFRSVKCLSHKCNPDTKPAEKRSCKISSSVVCNSRNRNEPILTSISFSVDNRSTPAPPSYEYVIKHPVITQSENQPPSYESLYDRMRNAHRTIRNTVRNGTIDHSSGTQKLSKILISILFFGFLIIMPILQIAIGIAYRNDCPANISIPLWLIVEGIFALLLVISILFFKYFDCSLMTSVLGVFLISWLIRGSIWIYGSKSVISFDSEDDRYYCNPVCFNVAFWSITSIWFLIGFFICTLIVAVVCSKKTNVTSQNNV